ncbi:hypothetical protein RND71_032073 [Anisodus tanguticus]|uniref:DYW domain-containing protein n=1 Tax=Anisodus tanguticus TaxID=243964 RepID=A0AAE1RD05_9SOLA|nr:hypothetical protein RND71_032073 [Anisodus tanguticus]
MAATISYALSIFNQVTNPTIFLFNTLISSSRARKGDDQTHFALALYTRILTQTTLIPNSYTYPSLFKACSSQPWLQHGRALHTHVLKFLEPPYDHFVQASLLNFYAKCRELGVSRFLFDQITKPDLASWNSILTAYARNTSVQYEASPDNAYDSTNLSLEVLLLFSQMQKSLTSPNEVSVVALISSCADVGALSQGLWAHSYVLSNGLKLNLFVGTALIALHANCGRLDFARQKMELEGLVPDNVTMLIIMCACSNVGLVDQGCKFFESMKEEYGIEPNLEHYGTLVDLFGRAGRVKEAEEIVQTIPMKPNAVLWRSLLGAARVHSNLEIRGLTKLLVIALSILMVPCTSSLLAIRLEAKLIYLKLDEMHRRLQEHGHKSRTREVLFDIEEEEKEDALSYHSERLAIAYALIASDSDAPTRIIKNLMVCNDCHTATKLISSIYQREIIVRDRSRFHHFRNGTCSCLNYW